MTSFPSGAAARCVTTRVRLLLVAMTLGLMTSVVTAGQDQASAADTRDFAAWRRAVLEHAAGQRDAPLARIATWSRRELDSVLSGVSDLDPEDRLSLVARATIFHADMALLNRTARGYNLPPDAHGSPLFADGAEVGQMFGTFHWDFGRRLIERLPQGDDRTRMARLFYRATAAILQRWGEQSELADHLDRARRVLRDDAVLLMYEGTMHQVHADARSQRYFDQVRRSAPLRPMLRAPGTERPRPPSLNASRSRAVSLFRRSLEADPLLHEARIRLAHVLGDRDEHEEALAELEHVAGSLPPLLAYYAAVVAGRANRALDNLDEAQRWFEQAIQVHAASQVARLALSELALARGDRPGARSHLLPVLESGDGAIPDPWWLVGRVHEPAAHVLIDQMRSGQR